MTKQIYEQKLKTYVELKDFLELPRCFDCDNLDKINGNVCTFHGGVPDEYLYSTTECADWHYLVPF